MRRTSTADYFLLGLPAVFFVALGIATLGRVLPQWVGTAYVAASALTFGFYGWDKRRARRRDGASRSRPSTCSNSWAAGPEP